jgi:uncharacterized membrane protein
MNKQEFLDILKNSLDGEVNPVIIEQNIRYYDQYIGKRSQVEEEEILDLLGDPRLIAKTIIEAERASSETNRYSEYYQDDKRYNEHYQKDYGQEKDDFRRRQSLGNYIQLKWYHYIVITLLLIILGYILFFIGKILFALIFTIGLPIIMVILIYNLLKNR